MKKSNSSKGLQVKTSVRAGVAPIVSITFPA